VGEKQKRKKAKEEKAKKKKRNKGKKEKKKKRGNRKMKRTYSFVCLFLCLSHVQNNYAWLLSNKKEQQVVLGRRPHVQQKSNR
jgi:hypothetical protein